MTLDELVQAAAGQRATDLHLEPELTAVFRVNGELVRVPPALSRHAVQTIVESILPDESWIDLQTRGSFDMTEIIAGVQCRINILKTDRGFGLAIRLLASNENTLASTNLHPCLSEYLKRDSGLIILTGPTGSGKSTTLAALLEEINQHQAKHIITLESPIEYRLRPKRSIIRQREVGVHTPSYEQGLMDSLREDPDVIVVGEMRDSDSMRWTLNAAETGHLVLATMHSSNAGEAISRMMMSFPPERQNSVLAQLADSLICIVAQKMSYRPEQNLLVPVLEILNAGYAAKNVIRKGEVVKITSLLQTGGNDGNWTFERYQTWLDSKTDWIYPQPIQVESGVEDADEGAARVSRAYRPSRVERLGLAPSTTTTPRAVPKKALNVETESRPLRKETRREPAREPSGESGGPEDSFYDQTIREALEGRGPAAPRAEREPPRPLASAPSPQPAARKRGKSATMKIHKDGRIEIPELDLDLNELAREIERQKGDV